MQETTGVCRIPISHEPGTREQGKHTGVMRGGGETSAGFLFLARRAWQVKIDELIGNLAYFLTTKAPLYRDHPPPPPLLKGYLAHEKNPPPPSWTKTGPEA